MWFPTVEQVIQIHDEILERTGGETGRLHRGLIEAALSRAQWGPFTQEGALEERAALLMRGIAQDHPFVDGNKRTSVEVADTFLGRNGYDLTASEDDLVERTVLIARGQFSLQEIARWIHRNMQKR